MTSRRLPYAAELLHASVFLTTLAIFLSNVQTASGIACFVCSSVNGSEPDCEDTFNNTGRFYQEECFAGRKERSGLFPGTECIKMKAALVGKPYTVLIRACVVDNGDINSATEIGRIDHCGFIDTMIYNDETYRGCILRCETDGCNRSAPSTTPPEVTSLFLLCLVSVLLSCRQFLNNVT